MKKEELTLKGFFDEYKKEMTQYGIEIDRYNDELVDFIMDTYQAYNGEEDIEQLIDDIENGWGLEDKAYEWAGNRHDYEHPIACDRFMSGDEWHPSEIFEEIVQELDGLVNGSYYDTVRYCMTRYDEEQIFEDLEDFKTDFLGWVEENTTDEEEEEDAPAA